MRCGSTNYSGLRNRGGRAAPGADYVKGANRQLSDQMLFGSVYPNCGPLKEVRQIVDTLGFASEEIKAKYLGGNARGLLGLPAT